MSPAFRCRSATSRWSISSSSTIRISPSTRTSPRRCASPAWRKSEIETRVQKAADLLRLAPDAEAPAVRTLRRPAAAHGDRPRPRQGFRSHPARRAARQSRLQAARGIARRIAEALRRAATASSSMRRPSRSEALLFGGNTATLYEGRITQFGPTSAIYRKPADLITAQVFSDPPINTAKIAQEGRRRSSSATRSNGRQAKRRRRCRMATTRSASGRITSRPIARRRRRRVDRGPRAGDRTVGLGKRRSISI